MEKLLKNLKSLIKNNYIIVVLGVLSYGIGIILGLIPFSEEIKEIYKKYAIDFYLSALSPSVNLLMYFLRQTGNILLLFIPIILLSLLRFTAYFNYIFIFYKGLMLITSFKCLFAVFGINGIIIFAFLSLILNVITTFAILLFILLSSTNKCSNKDIYINNLIKIIIVSLSVAVIGAIIELLLLITVIRPLNFFF